jgi:chromosomal replication initiator protein
VDGVRPKGWAVKDRPTTVSRIVAASAVYFGAPGIMGHSRSRSVVIARHVAIYICRNYVRPQPSYPELGRWFGNRDHTTAIHAVKNIERRYAEFEEAIRSIRSELGREIAAERWQATSSGAACS